MTRLLIIAGFAGMAVLVGGLDRHPGFSASRPISFLPPAASNIPPASNTPPAAFNIDTADPSFLVISDIHLYNEGDQSPAVTRNSDTGKDLWDSAQNKIRSVLSGNARIAKPEFIIYLGDLPWHAKYSSQVPGVMKNAGKVLADLRTLAETANVPLLYVPGNNDSEDSDYAPFSNSLFREDSAGSGSWPVIGGKPVDTTVWNLGCYAAAPLKGSSKLLVLVLNTNIFTLRYGLAAGSDKQNADATREIEWLRRRLRIAAASHRHVLIAMHVPPGKDGYLKAEPGRETCTGKFKDLWDPAIRVQKEGQPPLDPQDAFLDLIDAYRHSIVGILGSHTHFDGIRLLKTRHGDSLSALLISVPGIAPGHGNNPGFKVIAYDPANFQLDDFITFYNNYYPTRTVTAWDDLSYSFSNIFHAPPGISMLNWVRNTPIDSLRKYVNSIYTVYNGDGYGRGNCVDTTLYVHYRP